MFTNVTDDMIDLQRNYFGYFLNSSIILNKCKQLRQISSKIAYLQLF